MGLWEQQSKRTVKRKDNWTKAQDFDFAQCLLNATNEEEVKAAYIKEFALPVNMQERIDLKVEKILFEFKYSVDLSDPQITAKVVAQALCYVRRFFEQDRIDELQYFVVADKAGARIFRVSDFQFLYESSSYRWKDFRPSSPDPGLVQAVNDSRLLDSNRFYRITSPHDLELLISRMYQVLPGPELQLDDSAILSTPRRKFYLIGFSLIALICGIYAVISYGGQVHENLPPSQSQS